MQNNGELGYNAEGDIYCFSCFLEFMDKAFGTTDPAKSEELEDYLEYNSYPLVPEDVEEYGVEEVKDTKCSKCGVFLFDEVIEEMEK